MLKQLNLKEIAFIQKYPFQPHPRYDFYDILKAKITCVIIEDINCSCKMRGKFNRWRDYDLIYDFKAAEIVQNLEWLIEQNNCKNNELTEIS